MLPTSIINASLQTVGRTKNIGDTISKGAVIKVSTLGSDYAPKE
jgi:ADP-dependent phosphofructokinase/glucokinase